MIGGGFRNEVVEYIEEWVPDGHDGENGFQDELRAYLDHQLNESGNPNVHIGIGGG